MAVALSTDVRQKKVLRPHAPQAAETLLVRKDPVQMNHARRCKR
jgi:hypothetical protein